MAAQVGEPVTLLVELREGGSTRGEVTDYTALSWAEELNTITGGTITLPRESEAVEFLNLAAVSADPVGLLITDQETGHQVPVFTVEEVDSSADEVSVPFVLDLGMLAEVPAFPDPANPTNPWGAVSHWVRTGDVVDETVQFILVHGGPFSHVDFRHFDAVTSTGTAGVSVDWYARMQPSLDVIRETVGGGAACEARIENGEMVMHVRGTVSRPEVVFSVESHTISEWRWRNRMPQANRFYAGGTGEGAAREIASAVSGSPLWPRARGAFLDQRNLSGADLQRAAANAAEWPGPTLEAVLAGDAVNAYGSDYLLGDMVTVEVRDAEYQLPVTAVDTSIEDEQVARKITVGAALLDARPDLQLARAMLRAFGLRETQ